MALLDRINEKLGKKPGADPLQDVLDTPTHVAGGTNRPLMPEDVNTDPPETVNPYVLPIEKIDEEEEEEIQDGAGNNLTGAEKESLRKKRKEFLIKQARRIIKRVNDLQMLFIELVLDIEDSAEFNFTDDEIEELLDCLPDVMEEEGIQLPPSYDLGITLAFMILKRVKLAFEKKKAQRLGKAPKMEVIKTDPA